MNVMLNLNLSCLPATLAPERPIPDTEFQRFCADNSLVQVERTSEGLIHLYPLNDLMTSCANASITAQLRNWWHAQDRQGSTLGSSAGFFLPDSSMLSPSAAYVSPERLEGVSISEKKGIPQLCPDFVVGCCPIG